MRRFAPELTLVNWICVDDEFQAMMLHSAGLEYALLELTFCHFSELPEALYLQPIGSQAAAGEALATAAPADAVTTSIAPMKRLDLSRKTNLPR
ncbi:hypothetical protein GCM10010166_66990 [Couchioplanes caeruleus subsp. azureus]|nr:hypothetical protein GCM10010166_66990 [Couchioplanes caeruleus subsp. azureus]